MDVGAVSLQQGDVKLVSDIKARTWYSPRDDRLTQAYVLLVARLVRKDPRAVWQNIWQNSACMMHILHFDCCHMSVLDGFCNTLTAQFAHAI